MLLSEYQLWSDNSLATSTSQSKEVFHMNRKNYFDCLLPFKNYYDYVKYSLMAYALFHEFLLKLIWSLNRAVPLFVFSDFQYRSCW